MQGMSEVTDEGVRQLSQLRGLEELELQFAWQFSDEGIAALTALSALSRLDLMYRWVLARAAGGRWGGWAGWWGAAEGIVALPNCMHLCTSAAWHVGSRRRIVVSHARAHCPCIIAPALRCPCIIAPVLRRPCAAGRSRMSHCTPWPA